MNTIAISQALRQLEQCHGSELVGIAVTAHLTRNLLRHQQSAHDINLSPHLSCLEDMIASHLAVKGINRADFDAALDDLLTAGQPSMKMAA